MKKKTSVQKKIANSKSRFDSEALPGEIISLILQDHKPIKELILTLKDPELSFAKKKPAFAEFERVLSTHAKSEEESLYIHLKQVDELCVQGIEGETEHSIAEQLMMEINEAAEDEDTWMAKVKVLAEVVDHHIKEEEKEILKEVKNKFDLEKRIEIGELYSRKRKKHELDFERPQKTSRKEEMRAEHA